MSKPDNEDDVSELIPLEIDFEEELEELEELKDDVVVLKPKEIVVELKKDKTGNNNQEYRTKDYLERRKKLSGFFFETALPNEYLVEVGAREIRPTLGGRRLRLFRKFLRVPASVQTLAFKTDNANLDYQGIGIEGFASWRIDPLHPEVAIKTLDFFDPDDPMARTNAELRTICIEAVRHVIANMGIDDALRKKDEIAENLRNQLHGIEQKWGIVFDQVGIEQVRIMSDKLFEQLQAQYRDGLRLEVERKRLATDQEIASEKNAVRERITLENQETDQKLELGKVDLDSRVRSAALAEKAKLAQQQLEVDQGSFREEQSFKTEKERSEHEFLALQRSLKVELLVKELELLTKKQEVENLRIGIGERQLDLERLRREVEQTYTAASLSKQFIEKLPELYASLKIGNYTVLDAGGGQVSPVTRLVGELAGLLKGMDLGDLFGPKEKP